MHQTINIANVKNNHIKPTDPCLNLVEVTDEISASYELIQILQKYNHHQGWTLLIAPDQVPSKSLLDSCAIDKSKLLVIRQKHLSNLEYVLNSALNNGNFSAVITWTNMMTNHQMAVIAKSKASHGTDLFCFTAATKPSSDNQVKN